MRRVALAAIAFKVVASMLVLPVKASVVLVKEVVATMMKAMAAVRMEKEACRSELRRQ
jgi:hypothetical protein